METRVKTNGKELAEQLLNDINRSMQIRLCVEDPNTQISKMDFNTPINFGNFMSATNVLSFDGDLKKVLQFINYYNEIVSQKANEKINIVAFQQDVKNNIDSIAEAFQKLLDSEVYLDDTHISVGLIEQLKHLHEDAN